MAGESDDLDRLFQLVADGEAIDWDALERAAPDDLTLVKLRRLRLIAEISEVHRSQVDEVATPDAKTGAEVWQGATLTPPPPPPRAVAGTLSQGDAWGHLRLIRKIGEGSYGEVYQAHDTWLDHSVALKLLKPGAEKRVPPSDLLHEARRLARVRHVNVVTVHGADRHHGRVGFWMDFIDGETLAARVAKGRMSAGEATSVGQEVCRALAAVHRANIIHRDVKAQNVMRAHDGGRIILMDFGAGQAAGGSPATRAQGTPLYLAPEILNGEGSTVHSDIYAAGILLYHLVTGRFPVVGQSLEALREAHERGERRRLRDERPDLPESFIAIVERATDRDPRRRYGSAGEMEARLSGESSERIHVVRPATSTKADGGITRTQRHVLIATAGVLAVTFVGFVTSFGYYSAIGLTSGYQQESLLTWPLWGIRALLPGAVLVVAVVSVGLVLVRGVYRQILMAFGPIRRALQPVDDRVSALVQHIRRASIGTSASLLLIVQCALLGLAWGWWFSDLWEGLDALISQTPGGSLSSLSPANHLRKQGWAQVFSLQFFGFAIAWGVLIKAKHRRREAGSWATIAGGIAVTVLTLVLLVVPYRIWVHNEHERVNYQSQICYLLGTQGNEALLFCPLQEPPRNRVVRLDDPALKRGGPVEDLFTSVGLAR